MPRLGLRAALAAVALFAALGCGNDDSGPGGAAGQVGAGSAGRAEDRGAGGEAGEVSRSTPGRHSASGAGFGGSEDGAAGARAEDGAVSEGGALPGPHAAGGDVGQDAGGTSFGGSTSEDAGDGNDGGFGGDAGDLSGGSKATAGSSSGGAGGVSSGATGGGTSGGSAGAGGTAGIGPSVTVKELPGSSGWGAWQDGDGHWQQFSTAGAQYTFTPTNPRYGVAIVGCWGMARSVNVQYRTTAVTSLNACDRVPRCPDGGVRACECSLPTITSTLTNIGTSGWLDVEGLCSCSGFGGREITPVGGSTTYSGEVLLPSDFLFAIASEQGKSFTRIAVQRNVNASTLDIDFDTDAQPAEEKKFTTTGLGASDTQSHSIVWRTSGSNPLFFEATTNADSADDTYSAIHESLVESGDMYMFSAQALQDGDSQTKTELWGQFATPADIAFPVSYVSATASVAASAPYGRVQVDLAAFPGAQHYAMEATGQVVNGSPTVRWWVDATPDWFTGAAPYRLAMPNLDSASGWDNSRGFTTGSRATIVAYASIPSALSDGSQTIVGQQSGLSAIP